ncbi:MAG: nucleotidyltransferase domain-containing protein [Chloroflexota bacterium]|nr:nucleotidyltransferase domain-containing protein [Anaerolineae bacterium]
MLRQLFSSRVRVKLLTIFLTNPDTRFYTRELSRLLEESPYALQRELHRLESVGLLEVEPEANIKYYAVDKSCPIYPELKSIVLKTTGLGDALREGLAELGTIEQAFIYGSVAAGEEDSLSDVDLMLVGEVDLLELSEIIARLEGQLGREINYLALTSAELSQRIADGDPFIENVLAGPKVMLIGDKDALRQATGTAPD